MRVSPSRSLVARALRALLVFVLVVAIGAPAAVGTAPARAADTADQEFPVLEVTGDDVNLRCGPSIDHHDVGQVSRGHWLLEVGRDGEFVRVRVPGGVPVFVFGPLLSGYDPEAAEPALRCEVDADDVLMRATPTTRHYPLRDQKLQRGTELVVISAETTEKGLWLRVVSPPDVHVWIHERYVRRADPAPGAHELARRAEARLDDLTDGRTRRERDARAARLRQDFEVTLSALRKRVDDGAHDAEVEAEVRALADTTGEQALRIRALGLAERIVGLREVAEVERLREAAERAQQDAEEARRRREAIEAERRRQEEERERRRGARGTPAGEGTVRVVGESARLARGGVDVLELRSTRFRLADYAGRRVRVWGHRHEREDALDRLEVTSIEIVTVGDE